MVAKSPVMSPDVCVRVIHKLGFGATTSMLGGNCLCLPDAKSTVGDRACRCSDDLGRRHAASRFPART